MKKNLSQNSGYKKSKIRWLSQNKVLVVAIVILIIVLVLLGINMLSLQKRQEGSALENSGGRHMDDETFYEPLIDVVEVENRTSFECNQISLVEEIMTERQEGLLEDLDRISIVVSSENYSDLQEGEEVDFANFVFVKAGSGEEIIVDLSKFMQDVEDYGESGQEFWKDHNEIYINSGKGILIDSIQVYYEEWEDAGEKKFKWHELELEGFLLEDCNYLQYGDLQTYLDELGVEFSYGDTVAQIGEPEKTIIGEYTFSGLTRQEWLAYFDGFIAIYGYEEDLGGSVDGHRVQINDEQYKFGDKQLCVGMSREEVEKIFEYTEGRKDVSFVYDNEGKVTERESVRYFEIEALNSMSVVYDEEDRIEYIEIGFYR